jgi:hypothetical protein
MDFRRPLVSFINPQSRIILSLIGIGLICWGYVEYRAGAGAGGNPVDVELTQIESGIVPESPYLHIGRHVRIYRAVVYATPRRNDVDPPVEYALFPIISTRHPYAAVLDRAATANVKHGEGVGAEQMTQVPLDFKVLVKTTRFHRQSELPARDEISGAVDGLLINRVSSLSDKESQLIMEMFPQANPDKLLILEEDRRPWKSSSTFLLMGSGVTAIGVALVTALMARRVGEAPAHTSYEPPSGPLERRLDILGMLFMTLAFSLAGGGAVGIVLALASGSTCLMALAAIVAAPFNIGFFIALGGALKGDDNEVYFGLGRTAWLMVLLASYALGVGGAVWMWLGW